MFLKTWRFITLVLTALTMGMLFCHTLEMPAKMQYDGSLWVTLQNTLFVYFGPPVGAAIEIGALLTAVILAFLVRNHRPAFHLTLVGALCLAGALVIYFLFTEPVNIIIEQATPNSLPSNWEQLRAQWEYSHAGRFILYLAGFSTFLCSILAEIPAGNPVTNWVEGRERLDPPEHRPEAII